ncbi:hypothetical protein H8D85_02405 [bacterium]|nr:hypothetical protein [bacterium]
MIDDIPSKEKVYRITDTDISMHSQDSFTRKLINPTYITKDDCQRSYAHSNLVKIIDKEPSTKSSVVNFEGSLNTTYVGGDKFELPFFDIKSDTFQKTEQDLLVYSKPLTDVIKRSSVRNIFRIEDKAFINEIDVILEDTLQKVSGSYTNEGDFTALFDIFKQQKLKAATLLMSSGTYSKLVGDSDNGPCRIMSSIIVTDRNNLIRDNLIYAFAPQECLGKFFIHDDIELHIEKTRNIISWSASVTLGIGISNINAIARLDLS